MFHASNAREMRNTLHKQLDVVIRGQTTTPSINLCISTCSPNPCNEMFEKTLIQLMEDIRCDGVVDVSKRKFFSKNTLNRFDSCISICFGEFRCSLIDGIESFNVFLSVTRLEITFPVIDVIVWCRTNGTITSIPALAPDNRPHT
jgi:hypothetical protein